MLDSLNDENVSQYFIDVLLNPSNLLFLVLNRSVF